jgi:hypothetical protein
MRPIKFRGKIPSYKKDFDPAWAYGSLLTSGFFTTRKQYNIVDENTRIFYNALPETIGQFTGVYDINGAEIYEGDIVEQFTLYLAYQQVGNYPPPNIEVEEWEIKREVNVVEFKDGSFCVGCMPIMLVDLVDGEEEPDYSSDKQRFKDMWESNAYDVQDKYPYLTWENFLTPRIIGNIHDNPELLS